MPLVETKGAASSQGFGQFAQAKVPANYIEDVFSTYLYTGNGSTQTITNGIDLAGKGGLVWIKSRSSVVDHVLQDSARGADNFLYSNSTSAEFSSPGAGSTFNSTGFATGSFGYINTSSATYASWTFRKQPKFFDVVTYTGDAVAGRTVAHNLGSVPGCIIVKKTSASGNNWVVYHRSLGATKFIYLNTTAAQGGPFNGFWNDTEPTSTVFSLGINNAVNEESATYVAYLFAHNAGGFGLTGTDNVISCGSFTCDGSGDATVSLGYEPQWILRKASNEITNWEMFDNMRGLSVTDNETRLLYPNLANAEENTSKAKPTATGFIAKGEISKTYIYIAIRRGPMSVPTDATKVFTPIAASNSGNYVVNAGFPPDMVLATLRDFTSGFNHSFFDRLRGNSNYLKSSATDAESGVITDPTQQIADFSRNQNGIFISSGTVFAYSSLLGVTYAWHNFRRAPSFMDVVCFSGNSIQTAYNHNLGIAPELVIVKIRNLADESWIVWSVYGTQQNSWATVLNGTNPYQNRGANLWGTDPVAAPAMTATTFRLGNNTSVNESGYKYVAYLFASCVGVSKVGTYTGTGSTQTISCGFTGGARFVMVKRTDSTGDWFVWDTARGMVSGTDPSFLLNTTGVEVNANSIYTTTGGFQIVSTAAGINASGGNYIFLAIA